MKGGHYTLDEVKGLQISLLLVLDKKVPLKVIKGWDAQERAAVQHWASASYLRASDNNVKVPPKPACLAASRREGREGK